MKLRNNQNGFSPVEIILVIGLVIALGAIGWLFMDRNKAHQSDNSKNTSETTGSDKQGLDNYFNDGPMYLELKEWGVKLPVVGDITDAYYLYKEESDTVYLSKDIYKKGPCAADSTSLGAISRVAVASTNTEEKTAYLEHGVELKGYYYFFVRPQAACQTDFTSDQQVNNYVALFKAAVDKLSE